MDITKATCYHIAQNFGGRELWRFTTDLPKFYPPTNFILAILLCKAASPPMFCDVPLVWPISLFDLSHLQLSAIPVAIVH